MTKQELIVEVAKTTKFPKTEVETVVSSVIDTIVKNIGKGVVLTGFGTFKVSKRKARTGRNPKTGESIQIPAMSVPRFKAGRVLKESVK